jgi:hypothetical protein
MSQVHVAKWITLLYSTNIIKYRNTYAPPSQIHDRGDLTLFDKQIIGLDTFY